MEVATRDNGFTGKDSRRIVKATVASDRNAMRAGWVLLTILLPFVGVLIYLIARGSMMHEHQGRTDRYDTQRPSDRAVPNADQASEISRLADLRDRSVITEAEFQQGKTKVFS